MIANCLTTTTTTTMMKPETTATIHDDDDDGDENSNKQDDEEEESCNHRIENDNSLENRYENLKIDKNSSLTNTTMNSVRKQQNSISLIKSSEDESMKSQKQLAQSSITNDSNVDDDDDDDEIYDNENNSNQQRTILAEKMFVKNDDTMTISSSSSSSVAKQWGEEIFVELIRSETIGFGISIIGGKEMTNMILLDNNNNDNNMNQNTATATTTLFLSGILIKKILPDSPAAKCGLIKMGDRLLQVDGIDLRHSTHDKAVDVIKKAKSPVKFLIQLLLPLVSR